MELLKLLEGIRSPFLDTVIGLITRLGEETVGIVILCLIFWCISKRAAYGIGAAFFFSGLTTQGLKICFRVDRPWIADPTLKPVESALENATGYSFPSGHTQSATALFGSLGVIIKNKPIKALCFFIVILVAFSRMYLGVHTPIDVVASLVISFLLVMLINTALDFGTISWKGDFIFSLIMMLYAAAVIVIAAVLYSNGTIGGEYVLDCFKAAGAGIGFALGMFVERVFIDFSVKTKNLLMQVIKYIIGFAGVLAIKEGLKLVAGTGLAINMFRYFLILIWIIVLFPLIIKRFFAVKDVENCPQ